jgi:hypothetical protein
MLVVNRSQYCDPVINSTGVRATTAYTSLFRLTPTDGLVIYERQIHWWNATPPHLPTPLSQWFALPFRFQLAQHTIKTDDMSKARGLVAQCSRTLPGGVIGTPQRAALKADDEQMLLSALSRAQDYPPNSTACDDDGICTTTVCGPDTPAAHCVNVTCPYIAGDGGYYTHRIPALLSIPASVSKAPQDIVLAFVEARAPGWNVSNASGPSVPPQGCDTCNTHIVMRRSTGKMRRDLRANRGCSLTRLPHVTTKCTSSTRCRRFRPDLLCGKRYRNCKEQPDGHQRLRLGRKRRTGA